MPERLCGGDFFLGMRLAAWWRVADVHALGSRRGWGVVACLCLFCASRLDFCATLAGTWWSGIMNVILI